MGHDDREIKPLPKTYFMSFVDAVMYAIDAPVTWFREKVVVPNRPEYYWYHRHLRRVPTIDECYTDDIICFTEANEQFKRDKQVESEILNILRTRMEQCFFYEHPDHGMKCEVIRQQYHVAADNWFTKYGDLGAFMDVRGAYMKQKHRMIWERRHGPVGSGMRPKEEWGMPYVPKHEPEDTEDE